MAVVMGAAVCAAIVTGALLVGDSVRGSLIDLALDRLGRIEWAVLSESFAPRQAGDPLGTTQAPAAPVILMPGTVTHAASGARADQTALAGVDERFDTLFPAGPAPAAALAARPAGLPPILLNAPLSEQLAARAGDAVLVSVPLPSIAPAESPMGRRDLERASVTLRAQVAGVLPTAGPGRFALSAGQALRPGAFLRLADLQRALDKPGRANAWLIAAPRDAASMEAALAGAFDLEDRGLRLTAHEGYLSIETPSFLLPPAAAAALEEEAAGSGGVVQRVRTTVAASIRRTAAPQREVPYSTVTAIDPVPAGSGLPWLKLPAGGDAPPPADDEILLGEWTAAELAARPGESIDLDVFVLDDDGRLTTRTGRFRLAGIVGLDGAGGDRSLTPAYPGIQDARHIADWDPPFPVDLKRVRPADEEYWERHGATPKAFVSGVAAERLWGGRHGTVTALRVAPPEGVPIDRFAADLRQAIRSRVPMEITGVQARPVRAEALEGARGSTDFGALFGGLSAFLIVSGALLAGLLFGLGVERRGREIGLLRAIGYPLRQVRRRFAGEGIVLALAGLALGLPAAVAYAALLMRGLRGAWRGAVGTSALWLHVTPLSLLVGGAIGFGAVMLAILVALRRMVRLEPAHLLAGGTGTQPEGAGGGRVAAAAAWGGLVVAAALLAWPIARRAEATAGLALAAGAAALVSSLGWFGRWCRATGRGRPLGAGPGALLRMAARNTAWSPGRSLLCVTLIASACFILAAVAAGAGHEDTGGRGGGTGGYTLVATSSIPLHADPGTPAGRAELGLPGDVSRALEDAALVSLRAVPGDDVSCLNLFRPQRPRLVGVTDAFIARGGFRVPSAIEPAANPWELLARPLEPGVIPAIGDQNSVQWILHLGLGKDLTVQDELGRPLRLRFVALLSGSLFQSEVLIHERDLMQHFPSRTGRSFFLLEAPPARAQGVAAALESALAREGFDAEPAGDRLARFREVERTYLATFQVLGGLGLLLGTCGLGVITARSLLERRAELAALRAFGFPRRRLRAMILAETALLVILGAAGGTSAALLALAPRLLSGAAQAAWGPLALTLSFVVIVGVGATVIATAMVLRAPLLPALRSDR